MIQLPIFQLSPDGLVSSFTDHFRNPKGKTTTFGLLVATFVCLLLTVKLYLISLFHSFHLSTLYVHILVRIIENKLLAAAVNLTGFSAREFPSSLPSLFIVFYCSPVILRYIRGVMAVYSRCNTEYEH